MISQAIKERIEDRSISLAKTFTESNDKVENKFSINGQFALMSYLWIINDYLTNGIYVNREKTLKINQKGKINWKRTLNRQPIISMVMLFIMKLLLKLETI